MILDRQVLIINRTCDDWTPVHSFESYICAQSLRRWFTIPKGTTHIEAVLHDRPSPNRVKVARVMRRGGSLFLLDENPGIKMTCYAEDRLLEAIDRRGGKPVFVEILIVK